MTTDATTLKPTESAAPDPPGDLKSLPIAAVQKRLGSSPDGLTAAKAAKRLAQYGPNEIAEHKTNPLVKFLSHFWGPIPGMVEVAVILPARSGTGRASSSFWFCCWPMRSSVTPKSARSVAPSMR